MLDTWEDCLRFVEECICHDECAECGHHRNEHAVFYTPSDAVSEEYTWMECRVYGNDPSIPGPIKKMKHCRCRLFHEGASFDPSDVNPSPASGF
jgi:hypothetical protein